MKNLADAGGENGMPIRILTVSRTYPPASATNLGTGVEGDSTKTELSAAYAQGTTP